jgi:hypothetical protein
MSLSATTRSFTLTSFARNITRHSLGSGIDRASSGCSEPHFLPTLCESGIDLPW